MSSQREASVDRVSDGRTSETEAELCGAICRIWAKALDINEVAADEDFFEIGGDSLLALETVTIINNVHQVDIDLADVFLNSTPALLAHAAVAGP